MIYVILALACVVILIGGLALFAILKDHEEAKAEQQLQRIAQMNAESRPHVRLTRDIYAPPAFGSHRTPWKDRRSA